MKAKKRQYSISGPVERMGFRLTDEQVRIMQQCVENHKPLPTISAVELEVVDYAMDKSDQAK